jgi:hypothetical protein
VREKYPRFPHLACAATLSELLRFLGHDIEYIEWAETLATRLKNKGWKIVEVHDGLKVGDVFVTEDLNDNDAADHIGLVAGLHRNPNLFYCIDNNLKAPDFKPYLRNVRVDSDASMPKRTPIDYLLRKE